MPAMPLSFPIVRAEVASSELTRDMNRDLVLQHIRSMQPVSRVDLARGSGLQPSTVSSIVEHLLEERWVRESSEVKTARGRRPTLLSLNDSIVFLAADIRPTHTAAAVIDLNGRLLERRVIPLSRDGVKSLDHLSGALLELLALHADKAFQGVGVSVPGRVDPTGNKLVFAPNLLWRDLPLRERLQQRLGLVVEMENAASATLLAELWFGRLDGIRNAALVTISEGIGGAVLADGRLITGQHGTAGEYGHIIVDPDGPLCGCGAHGCWEMYASSRATERAYRELEPGAPARTVLELHGMAMDGDPSARTVLTGQARAVGRGLHLLNAMTSPELVLLGGDVPIFYGEYKQIIESESRSGAMDGIGPVIRPLGDVEFARLRGAAAVVLQRHQGYYRTAHMRVDQRSQAVMT